MTSRTPQLIVTLTPQGALAVELPGHMATRRQVLLAQGEAGPTLLRMLEAQARDGMEIGLDGAPTQAQVRHWERHSQWPSSSCRFCLAEGRATPDHKRGGKAPIMSTPDGVQVRRLRAGQSFKHKVLSSKRSPGDLGL